MAVHTDGEASSSGELGFLVMNADIVQDYGKASPMDGREHMLQLVELEQEMHHEC